MRLDLLLSLIPPSNDGDAGDSSMAVIELIKNINNYSFIKFIILWHIRSCWFCFLFSKNYYNTLAVVMGFRIVYCYAVCLSLVILGIFLPWAISRRRIAFGALSTPVPTISCDSLRNAVVPQWFSYNQSCSAVRNSCLLRISFDLISFK